MKQTITKVLLGLLGLGLIGYVGRLMTHTGITVTKDPMWNIGGFAIAAGIGAYILLILAQPQFLPKSKWVLSILGIAVLIIAQIIFQDNPAQHIYLQDIMKLFGVLFIVGGATGLFYDEQLIEARKMEEAEIIEV